MGLTIRVSAPFAPQIFTWAKYIHPQVSYHAMVESLPSEDLCLILQHLSLKDSVSLSRTCSTLYKAVEDFYERRLDAIDEDFLQYFAKEASSIGVYRRWLQFSGHDRSLKSRFDVDMVHKESDLSGCPRAEAELMCRSLMERRLDPPLHHAGGSEITAFTQNGRRIATCTIEECLITYLVHYLPDNSYEIRQLAAAAAARNSRLRGTRTNHLFIFTDKLAASDKCGIIHIYCFHTLHIRYSLDPFLFHDWAPSYGMFEIDIKLTFVRRDNQLCLASNDFFFLAIWRFKENRMKKVYGSRVNSRRVISMNTLGLLIFLLSEDRDNNIAIELFSAESQHIKFIYSKLLLNNFPFIDSALSFYFNEKCQLCMDIKNHCVYKLTL